MVSKGCLGTAGVGVCLSPTLTGQMCEASLGEIEDVICFMGVEVSLAHGWLWNEPKLKKMISRWDKFVGKQRLAGTRTSSHPELVRNFLKELVDIPNRYESACYTGLGQNKKEEEHDVRNSEQGKTVEKEECVIMYDDELCHETL